MSQEQFDYIFKREDPTKPATKEEVAAASERMCEVEDELWLQMCRQAASVKTGRS
jgi:hypothetical protein